MHTPATPTYVHAMRDVRIPVAETTFPPTSVPDRPPFRRRGVFCSPSLFEALGASLDEGVITVSWEFMGADWTPSS